MKSGAFAAALALVFAAAFPATADEAPLPEKRVIVVIGPADDPLGSRLEKELGAMSFEVTRSTTNEGCGRVVIAERVTAVKAIAATCSDGLTIDVWVVEASGLRLRDAVAVGSDDEHAYDVAAVRAAEITRASLAIVDEPAPPPPDPRPPPTSDAPLPLDVGELQRDVPPPPPRPALKADRVPTFTASAGISSLIGIDATVPAFSLAVAARVASFLEIAARMDYPISSENRDSPSLANVFGLPSVAVRPAFFGIGVDAPILPPAAFALPRVGAGVGLVWLHTEPADAATPQSFGDAFPGTPVAPASVTTKKLDLLSAAAFLTAGVSLRVIGPQARLVVDGVLGSTAQRLVVRSAGSDVAYWGQPFASLGVRFEVMVR